MCIGDKAYCKKMAQHNLIDAAIFKKSLQLQSREVSISLAAAWMVMYASAK